MTPAQLTLVKPGGATSARLRVGQSDGYLSLLAVLALAHLMIVHIVPFAWFPATFPAVGIILAIAGSSIAGALDRSQHRPLPVVKRRIVQLLAPVWAMGAILVPLMLVLGWTDAGETRTLEATSLLNWILPITPPPASALGQELAMPFWMWTVSCWLWLLALSPALLWLFRRWPKRTLAVPASVLVLNVIGLAPLTGDVGGVVLAVCTFTACWLLGFAHHDGMLARMRLGVALLLGAALCGLGVAGAYALPTVDGGASPEETPLSYALLSAGLVLVLLRLHPLVRSWFGAHSSVSNVLGAVDRRGVTLFLWAHASVSLADLLVRSASAQPWWPDLHEQAWVIITVALATLLLVLCTVCLGWVEDKAAGRPARLSPWAGRAEATVPQHLPARADKAADLIDSGSMSPQPSS